MEILSFSSMRTRRLYMYFKAHIRDFSLIIEIYIRDFNSIYIIDFTEVQRVRKKAVEELEGNSPT